MAIVENDVTGQSSDDRRWIRGWGSRSLVVAAVHSTSCDESGARRHDGSSSAGSGPGRRIAIRSTARPSRAGAGVDFAAPARSSGGHRAARSGTDRSRRVHLRFNAGWIHGNDRREHRSGRCGRATIGPGRGGPSLPLLKGEQFHRRGPGDHGRPVELIGCTGRLFQRKPSADRSDGLGQEQGTSCCPAFAFALAAIPRHLPLRRRARWAADAGARVPRR